MYTMRDYLMDYVKEHPFPTVVDYTKLMEEHEYHMMKFLMLSDENKRKVAAECAKLKQTLTFYFSDWNKNHVLVDDRFYTDEIIGAAMYCFLELFDVVYRKKTYLPHIARQLYVSGYLVLVDTREEYKADLVKEFAAECKYHHPYIAIFDTPMVCSVLKFQMRLRRFEHSWLLYDAFKTDHTFDWKTGTITSMISRLRNSAGYELTMERMRGLSEWEIATGRWFDSPPEWYKVIQQTSDPAHFEEDHPTPRGATIFEPQKLIRNKKDE